MSDDEEQHSPEWFTHKRIRLLERHRSPDGVICYELEVCDECGVKTPKLDWYTCDEWVCKNLIE